MRLRTLLMMLRDNDNHTPWNPSSSRSSITRSEPSVLGANDGLLSTASLMMAIGAVRKDVKTMILTGIARTVGLACSMAIGEFVSVYSQYGIEMSQIKRGGGEREMNESEIEEMKKHLPSPLAAATSAAAFVVGGGAAVGGSVY
ncbi:hypothetical protein LOK49_LG12G00238 [Camellia lanceoleosa]|uniref:Uncharacterized protein n=1 Tax=Camellia lanceoleosa TaxID=1840588 RepID=A0ACC0FUD8_9ERIC|nr:hypothetical protein LOK49_LG12G00238 [Camellia lanceoleosa]